MLLAYYNLLTDVNYVMWNKKKIFYNLFVSNNSKCTHTPYSSVTDVGKWIRTVYTNGRKKRSFRFGQSFAGRDYFRAGDNVFL